MWRGAARALFSDPLPEVRVVAVRIAQMTAARDVLRRLRHDESVRVRAMAFEALDALGAGDAEPGGNMDLAADARQRRTAVILRRALGAAALKAGRVPAALRYLEEAVVFDPDSAACWEALAPIYEAAGRRGEALAAWARAGSLGHPAGGVRR